MVAFMFPVSVIGGAGAKPPQSKKMTKYISLCSESSFGLDTFANNFIFHNFNLTYG